MRKNLVFMLNFFTVVFVDIGLVVMSLNNKKEGRLMAIGPHNLRYYTVLSNILAGIVAMIFLITCFVRKNKERWKAKGWLLVLKIMSSAAVTVTFLTILLFLGPLYHFEGMYSGSNLWFHLIVPLVSISEFIILDTEGLKAAKSFYAGITTLLYGSFYLINILINGVGEWPNTNDWYGFVNWGLPIGIVIFLVIVLISIAVSALLIRLNQRVDAAHEKRKIKEAADEE